MQLDIIIRTVTTAAIHRMGSALVFTAVIHRTSHTTDIIRIMDIDRITVTMADPIMAAAMVITEGTITTVEDTAITADRIDTTGPIRIAHTDAIRGFKNPTPGEAAAGA
jgi:hypothetical protein